MKGTIQAVIEKKRQSDGKPYFQIIMKEGDKTVEYLSSNIVYRGQEQKEVEYEVRPGKKEGDSSWIDPPGQGNRYGSQAGKPGGYQRSTNESFAASYAKDITSTMIKCLSLYKPELIVGITLEDTVKTVDRLQTHFFNYYMQKLTPKAQPGAPPAPPAASSTPPPKEGDVPF